MQDPSGGVQPPLDKHLHLVSAHQFPIVAQLNLQQAFEYLIQAPSIVKQVAPMSWTYVQPPQDGTIWLEWLSATQNGGRFPSDGYVWADQETSYRQSINGYTIELMIHQAGFRPGFDHMTSHARTRYHLIAKQGNINAPPPDPSLWIVHYHHSAQQRLLPTSQVPLDAYTRRVMQDRGWLESQGRIERRDFMLHDREHWPHIAVPGAQPQRMPGQPGFYPPNAMPNQGIVPPNNYSQNPFPQQGPPSAKRPRLQGPGHMSMPMTMPMPMQPAAEVPSSQDLVVEEEEFAALGDYFDHLTPREISMTRYKQHYNWMAELFASPYGMTRIAPADLGLGLMGELKGLTDGILQPPDIDAFLDRTSTDPKASPREASFFQPPRDQLEEFNARVQKHIEEGKAEIERVKAEHAIKMRAWRKTAKLTQAERRLRGATWKGHERAIFKPSDEGDTSTEGPTPVVEDVIASVEQLTGLKVKSHALAALIDKGGLEHIERPVAAVISSQQRSNASSNAPSEAVSFQQTGTQDQQRGASSLLNPAANAGAGLTQPEVQATSSGPELDLLNDSMDIDGADLNFDLGDTPADSAALEAAAPKELDEAVASAGSVRQDASAATSTGNIDVNAVANDTAQETNNSVPQDGEMFNESNFDFGNAIGSGGDDVGDGLIDFGDEGMDDSAFGDALHGMDS